jgi:hypothetical protein
MKESPVMDGRGFSADEMKKALRRHDTSVFEQFALLGEEDLPGAVEGSEGFSDILKASNNGPSISIPIEVLERLVAVQSSIYSCSFRAQLSVLR